VEALTGMSYELASFLIPWGVILYTASGGLQATFLASYLHTVGRTRTVVCNESHRFCLLLGHHLCGPHDDDFPRLHQDLLE
jgi:hypothetical protein